MTTYQTSNREGEEENKKSMIPPKNEGVVDEGEVLDGLIDGFRTECDSIDVGKIVMRTNLHELTVRMILGLSVEKTATYFDDYSKDELKNLYNEHKNNESTEIRILVILKLLKLCTTVEEVIGVFHIVRNGSFEESLIVRRLAEFYKK